MCANIIPNITDLSDVFRQMTILFKALPLTRTDGIKKYIKNFNWHLGSFYFNFCSRLIDCCRFCAVKLNDSIECHNLIY